MMIRVLRCPAVALISALSLLMLTLSAILPFALTPPAAAQAGNLTVRVIIESVATSPDTDGNFPAFDDTDDADQLPDMYAVVSIGGDEFRTSPVAGHQIQPKWEFSRDFDASGEVVPVKISIYDADGISLNDLLPEDDRLDAAFGINDDVVDSEVRLRPCAVKHDRVPVFQPKDCDNDLSSGGDVYGILENGGSGFPPPVALHYRIIVVEPPSAPGLNVRCTHRPTWPQPGEDVTITAESLDGTLGGKTADIEVWVNDKAQAAASTSGVTMMTHNAGSFTDDTFSYGCRVVAGDDVVFSGWRTVRVGGPSTELAVPVLYHGNKNNHLDIVFFADVDSYTGGSDSTFLDDVMNVITNAYYSKEVFLVNQNRFNFWVARDTPDAEVDCAHTSPANRTSYDFGDTLLILHRDFFRDCATGGLISSEPVSPLTVLHESGHDPFGMADEYCCDGGYWQPDPNPNMYATQAACAADAPALARTAADCRQPSDTSSTPATTIPWFVSDPSGDDLMESSGSRTPQAADIRRIEWLFDRCVEGLC